MALTINPNLCPQNHRCPIMSVCPMEAISQDGNGSPVIDDSKCAQCMDCVSSCPMQAVQQN
jgi:Fe-S-cluster-containing hydrogenase component 2